MFIKRICYVINKYKNMYIKTQLHYDKRESTIVTKSSYTLHLTSFKVHRLKAKSNVPHNELNSVDHLYTAKHTPLNIYYSTLLVVQES